MNDIVSMRYMRPRAAELSSRHAAADSERDFEPVSVWTVLKTLLSTAAGIAVLEIDDLERGDNCSSLAAGTGLKLHAEICLY